MVGFGELLLALVGFALIIAFLVGIVLTVWKVVHNFRRQHRLEAENDEREHRKQLAEDWKQSIEMLNGGETISFSDYTANKIVDKVRKSKPVSGS